MSLLPRISSRSDLSRRDALRLLATTGAGSLPGGSLWAGCQPSASGDSGGRASSSHPSGSTQTDDSRAEATEQDATMRRREIPSSGEMLPVVGLGTWQQFDVGTSESARAPLKEVLRRMVELGGALSTLRRCTAAPSRSLAT